jgi:cobalt-zinc-cadmium resistance protein CzcA
MLDLIVHWSLRNRFLVLLGTVALTGLGAVALHNLAIDAFPDTTPVQVQINTVAPALAPEEVERQITFPVEQALGGLPGLETLRSISKFGLFQVVVVFRDGTDIYFARQQVAERLSTVELPPGIGRPKMGPIATGLGEVLHYAVTGENRSLDELRTIHDWVIRPALRTVPGVAEINSWGGMEKQYQVRIDPQKLLKHGLSFQQVAEAVRENNLNVGGGDLRLSGETLLVHGVAATRTVDEICGIVITAKDGVPIRVADVAEVQTGHEIRRGAATANGKGEIVLGLGFMLMGENSHDVTRRLLAKLDEIRPILPPGVEVKKLYDRTELVDHVIDTVRTNLFEGGLLVIAVLFLFLGNLRAGLIVALAIPLSMLFAFSGMWRFAIAGSLLSLGALDFGLVVDSSVVLVENVVSHLAHDRCGPRDKREVVADAAIEVRRPTLFGELIIMTVYLPILTLEGVEGKLFRPMALTVIFALAGSLIFSLTLMPVLCSLVLPRRLHEREPLLIRLAARVYRPILHAALYHRIAVLGGAVAALGAAVIIARGLGADFIPRLSEGAIGGNIFRLAGVDINEANRLNTSFERTVLAKFPDEVQNVWCRCGVAEVATDPMGIEETDFFIALKPRSQWRPEIESQDKLMKLIEKEVDNVPGQKLSFSQPIEQRVNEMTTGSRFDVVVKLYGDDFAVLLEKGETVEKVLKAAGGADISTEQVTGQPVLQIRVRQNQLARYGVPARQVLDLIESLGSKPLGEVVEGQLRFPLVVRLPERFRASPKAVGDIPVAAPGGELLPLSALATIQTVEAPAKIGREWGQRRIAIQCNVRHRDQAGFVADVRRQLASQLKLPPGRYRWEIGGQFENLERARTRLLIVVPAALLIIFTLLYTTYGRIWDSLRVFSGVPFAAVGGVIALWARDMPFSISAGVGFIALSGVSVLGDMVLVSRVRQLLDRGLGIRQAVEEAAMTRLRPVLMTGLVASFGFLPMALSHGMGAEVQRPLATVVIGGVVSSTLLTLLVLPVLYTLVGGGRVTTTSAEPSVNGEMTHSPKTTDAAVEPMSS